jgi:hypothetical protein
MPIPCEALSSEQRAAIRRDYADASMAVPALLKRHDISQSTLYHLRRTEGWPLRQPETAQAMSRAHGERRLVASDASRFDPKGRRWHDGVILARRRAVLATLVEIAGREIEEVRAELKQGDLDPSERERRARVLASLTRTFRDAARLSAEVAEDAERFAARKAQRNDAQPVTRSLDEARQEFARRLQAIFGTRDPPRFSE